MGFVGEITKTTENPAIKYKSLYFSNLYSIFRRFSILFIDLVGVHEVLPQDLYKVDLPIPPEKEVFRKIILYSYKD